jgi:MSHA pilin protein MshD
MSIRRLRSLRKGGSPVHGFTLIELIVFIVMVSTALAGVLSVLNTTVKSSADPMVRKQMLSIAEALLEEVQLQAFTWCDPNDAAVYTALSAAGCTTGEGLGPEGGETRTSNTNPFDNISDYHNLTLSSPIPSITNTRPAPAGYSATVVITPEALNGVGNATAASPMLRIAVTVSYGGDSLVLESYRARYAPNSPP